MEHERRCMSCMCSMGAFSVCPNCGWSYGAELNDTYHLRVGTVLKGRYQIGKVKIQEAATITYAAWDSAAMKQVELKEYYPASLARRAPGIPEVVTYDDKERRKRFDEGKRSFIAVSALLKKLSPGPGIINVLDCFEDNSTAYQVTEYLEGISLGAFLRQGYGSMNAGDALNIAGPLCRALDFLHKKGLLIRSLNPDSVILTVDNRVKIANFDEAVLSKGKAREVFSPELYKGYLAPELKVKKARATVRSDIYSLCSVLYYALTGSNVTEQEITGGMGDIYSPAALGKRVPESMDLALMKGLAAEADLRFRSCADLFDALSGKVLVKPVSSSRKSAGRKKTVAVLVLALSTALAVSLFFVYSVVLGGIFDDDIEIWLPEFENSRMSGAMHQIFDIDQAAEGSVCTSFLEEHSNVGLTVEWIPEAEYTRRILSAAADDALPELFYSLEMLPELDGKIIGVDPLLRQLYGRGDCGILERYAERFPEAYYLPTAVDLPVLYTNTALLRSSAMELPESAALDTYMELLGVNSGAPRVLAVSNAFAFVLDDDLSDAAASVPDALSALSVPFEQIERSFPQSSAGGELMEKDLVYGTEELYSFVGSISQLPWVQKALPGYYGIGCLEDAPVSFTGFFCISDSTANKEKIAKDIALRLFDNGTQALLNISGSGLIPVEDRALAQYPEIYTDFDHIEEHLSTGAVVGEEWYAYIRENY